MKLPRLWPWVLAFAVLALAGCASSSPESRIKRSQAAFNSYPPEVQQKIRAGEVVPGFTPEQVRLALGEPDRVSTVTSDSGVSEVWSYRERKPRMSFGLGVGGGSGSTGYGAGMSVGSAGRPPLEVQRVTFSGGKVSAVEHAK